jgi:hypothetical protein
MQLAGGDQPVGNTPWRSLYRRRRSGTRPSTRVVPSALDRFICVWKHELIPRTPISTRSRSTNTRRRELAAIRGRVSWRGYVRVGSFATWSSQSRVRPCPLCAAPKRTSADHSEFIGSRPSQMESEWGHFGVSYSQAIDACAIGVLWWFDESLNVKNIRVAGNVR